MTNGFITPRPKKHVDLPGKKKTERCRKTAFNCHNRLPTRRPQTKNTVQSVRCCTVNKQRHNQLPLWQRHRCPLLPAWALSAASARSMVLCLGDRSAKRASLGPVGDWTKSFRGSSEYKSTAYNHQLISARILSEDLTPTVQWWTMNWTVAMLTTGALD